MYRYREKVIKSLFLLVLVYIFLFCSALEGTVSASEYYPLVVFGGEPEGVAAAVAAAREGIDTLLLLKRKAPGGLMTYGGLNFLDINQAPDGISLNKGIFAEWHAAVGGKITFSINKATEVFEELLAREKNITVLREVSLISVENKGGQVRDIRIEHQGMVKEIRAEYFIDASQDADLAVIAGAPYFKGGADIGLPDRHMAATLVLHMDNVNWQELARDARSNKFGPSYINRDNAWGFVRIGQLYEPVDKNTRLRGLNIVIEEAGDVYINALLIFDFDPTDPESLQKAHLRGQKEAEHVLAYLKENLAGFKKARLLPFPPELYVRESRHIVAGYQLQVADLLNNRIPFDTIALASYPLDYQASTPEYEGFVLFNPAIYGVPLRSLLPRGYSNLFVVGRSSGYSSLAAASARVLPTGISTGEAAGLVSSYLIEKNMTIPELLKNERLIKEIQGKLKISRDIERYKNYIEVNNILRGKSTGDIFPAVFNTAGKREELLEHLEYLMSWGLLMAGYSNDLRLKEEISERDFAYMIIKALRQQKSPILYEWVPGGLESVSTREPLTRNRAAMLLLVATSRPITNLSSEGYYQKALEYDLVPEIISSTIIEDRILNRAEAYVIISSFLQKYPVPEEIKFYRGE
ncbi:MAG: FAD-dependent oxidoreductase [Halanaerobiaceae bacterium]|nr:FAD-dependent oxidoreductase [Halanaerobiaceae bacterium]